MSGGLELWLTGVERWQQGALRWVKMEKEGGFWPPGSTAYICGDENEPAWGHDRSVRPPVVSRSGEDGAVHRWRVKPALGG
jgi:hypothetical protein